MDVCGRPRQHDHPAHPLVCARVLEQVVGEGEQEECRFQCHQPVEQVVAGVGVVVEGEPALGESHGDGARPLEEEDDGHLEVEGGLGRVEGQGFEDHLVDEDDREAEHQPTDEVVE